MSGVYRHELPGRIGTLVEGQVAGCIASFASCTGIADMLAITFTVGSPGLVAVSSGLACAHSSPVARTV